MLSRTASSRAPSASSRNNSQGSHGNFSSSVGQNNRPQTSYGHRSGSSFSQSTRTTSALPKSRPATAMAQRHEEEEISGSGGRRKGTTLLTFIPFCIASNDEYSMLQNSKLQEPALGLSSRLPRSSSNSRDLSLSTAMTRLTLDEEAESCDEKEIQAISLTLKPPRRAQLSKINIDLMDQKINSSKDAFVLYEDPGDSLVAPKTPSRVPVLSKMEAVKNTPATPYKAPKQSPQKTPFLTKDSNITGFIAWDVDGRLEHMESMYSKFEETIKSTTFDRNGLEEALNAYKARCK